VRKRSSWTIFRTSSGGASIHALGGIPKTESRHPLKHVSAAVILDHRVGAKVDHLREDGGFWTAHAESGADRGNTGVERQGRSIRAIARELGVSRVTVRRYLQNPKAGRYGPRDPRPTKLGPYIEYVRGRVGAARPKWTPATVSHREIRERGYAGGLTQPKAYLAPLKRGEPQPWCALRPSLASRCRPKAIGSRTLDELLARRAIWIARSRLPRAARSSSTASSWQA
jgi:hypothetical protein